MDDRQHFRLQRPPPSVRPWLGYPAGGLLLLFSLISLCYILFADATSFDPTFSLVMLYFAITILSKTYGGRQNEPVAPLVVGPEQLSLPTLPLGTAVKTIPLSDLTAAYAVMARENKQALIISSLTESFVYPPDHFSEGGEPAAIVEAIGAQVLAHPDGETIVRRMANTGRRARQAIIYRPRVTTSLLITIIAVYGLQCYFDCQLTDLVWLGANAPGLVAAGQYHRLATATFLHGSFLHLLFNGIALSSLGSVLEKVIGSWRYFIVFVTAAWGGSLASAMRSSGSLSVGSSTALFGLLGSFLVIHLKFGHRMPAVFRQTKRWWAFILGINLSLPVLIPQIDMAAHVGGFVAGLVVTLLCFEKSTVLEPAAPPSRRLRTVAVLVGACFAAMLISGVHRTASSSPERAWQDFIRTLPVESVRAAIIVNEQAWALAIDPRAAQPDLDEQIDAMEGVLSHHPHEGAFLDTLATLYHRRGNYERALTTQVRALRHAGKNEPVFAAQLARFIVAYRKSAPGPAEVTVSRDGDAVLLRGPAASTVYCAVAHRNRLVGLLQVPIPAEGTVVRLETMETTSWPPETRFYPGLVVTSPPPAPQAQWRFYRFIPLVGTWP